MRMAHQYIVALIGVVLTVLGGLILNQATSLLAEVTELRITSTRLLEITLRLDNGLDKLEAKVGEDEKHIQSLDKRLTFLEFCSSCGSPSSSVQ